MKKEKNNKVLISILVLLVIGLTTFIVYDQFIKNDKNADDSDKQTENIDKEKNKETSYNVSDYVTVSDFSSNKNGILNKIDFKNLPSEVTKEFNKKHTDFISYPTSDEVELSNEIVYTVDKNILSIYTKEKFAYPKSQTGPGREYKFYSLNIDLKNKKVVTNQELLSLYGISLDSVYERVLNNIANTINIDYVKLLLSADGDVSAPSISIDQFKNNIPTYAKSMINHYDEVTLYINDGKIMVTYDQSSVLKSLGISSHMGSGLVLDPQSISAN